MNKRKKKSSVRVGLLILIAVFLIGVAVGWAFL